MGELSKRVAVAAVGVPAVLGLLYVGGWPLAIPLALFAALGTGEFYRFARALEIRPFEVAGLALSAVFVLVAAWRPSFPTFAPVALALLVAVTGGALVAAMIARGPDGRPIAAAAITVFGPLYAAVPLAVVPMLHALPAHRGWGRTPDDAWAGLVAMALPLACTWIGDAAAYFAGSAWGRGRAKLAPAISPNKSWVGFWAGVGGAALAGAVWFFVARTLLPGLPIHPAVAVLIGGVLGLAAVFGDLVESLMKREAGVKDSGMFFPGHGGVLDRLDALVFTLPIAYVALAFVGGAS